VKAQERINDKVLPPLNKTSLGEEFELIRYNSEDIGIPAIESAASAVHKFEVFISGGYLPKGKGRSGQYFKSKDYLHFVGPIPMGISARNGHCMLSVNEELYIIGGYSKDFSNEIFRMEGDRFYFQSNAPWEPRAFFGCINYEQGVLVFGGNGYNKAFKDVWYSKDLLTWKLISTEFPKSGMFSTFVNDKVITVVNGGIYNTNFKNNVEIDFAGSIKSYDGGISWKELNELDPPPQRFSGSATIDNTNFIVGGYRCQSGSCLNIKNIYLSKNQSKFKNFDLSEFRSRHAPIVYEANSKIYILNGNDGRVFRDFWVIQKIEKKK